MYEAILLSYTQFDLFWNEKINFMHIKGDSKNYSPGTILKLVEPGDTYQTRAIYIEVCQSFEGELYGVPDGYVVVTFVAILKDMSAWNNFNKM